MQLTSRAGRSSAAATTNTSAKSSMARTYDDDDDGDDDDDDDNDDEVRMITRRQLLHELVEVDSGLVPDLLCATDVDSDCPAPSWRLVVKCVLYL